MSRLIVLSNRVKMPDNNPMAGGLAVALQDVLLGNSGIWMGWNGDVIGVDYELDILNTNTNSPTCSNNKRDSRVNQNPNDNVNTNNPKKPSENLNTFTSQEHTSFSTLHLKGSNSKIKYITTTLTTRQYQHYYCGFANNVLWPMLHDQTDLMSQAPHDYEVYQCVNRLFAKQLKEICQPDDVIWVHDYHFLSVAYYCRQLGMRNRIGFFLHIPFAPLTYWQQLDKSPELIYHLAHYNVLGTQTQRDKSNCLDVFEHYFKDRLLNKTPFKTGSINGSLKKSQNESLNDAQPTQNLKTTSQSPSVHLKLDLDLDAPHCLLIDAYPIGVNVAKIQQQVSHLTVKTRNAKTKTPKTRNDTSSFDSSSSNSSSSNSSCSNTILNTNSISDSNDNSNTISNSNSHTISHTISKTPKASAQQIIAVDRIDYSKGLLQRFTAYRTFLQHYPSYLNQLAFLQIACPSRLDLDVYQRLYDNVKQIVDDVNQEFTSEKLTQDSYQIEGAKKDTYKIGKIKPEVLQDDIIKTLTNNNYWQAISYSESVVSHETLMTAFWHSDVGWVNSLKDGMNLVAKEYIAAQNPDNPGVLVLSCYAGAAEQMQEAVIIDPKKPDSVIQGLKTALEMPLDERKSRHHKLLKGLKQHSLHDWQQSFLDDLYGREEDKVSYN